MNPDSTLGMRGVTRWLGRRPVLRDVSLDLPRGAGVALGGPNGSGKTTIWRILAGLLRPQAGCVTWEGRPVTADDWPALRMRIGVVGHVLMAQPSLTGWESLAFFGRLHGLPRPRQTAAAWLERVGLADVAAAPLASYSRGQRQRWAIARAWQHEPDVLLLDEPFAGLDSDGISLLTELLEAHHRRGGASLLIDHDWARACRLARERRVLAAGRLLAAERPAPGSGEAAGSP